MPTLAEIRKKLLEEHNKKNKNYGGDNQIYPHWNTPENETSVIRFLPDGNQNNDFFWVERQMINLTFSGVKGHDEGKPVIVKVPCIEMWENELGKCPIHEEIRPWFKDSSMEDIARKYWKKRSYLYQGFVVNSAFDEEEEPEIPIRRFVMSPQLHKKITSALMDPDFGDVLPTDYDEGFDFRITKTKQGQYADYSTSTWARKPRSLNQEERDAIETHGLFDLADFLPKKPSQEDIKIIFEMFEASVNGELYDPDRFAEYYRPYGMALPDSGSREKAETNVTKTTKSVAKPAVVDEDDVVAETDDDLEKEVVVAEPKVSKPASAGNSGGVKDAKDILAAIRARKAQ